MTIQVFPTSPILETLPPGASSILINGFANQSGFTFTSTISSGTKIYYAQSSEGDLFVVNTPDNKKASVFPSGSYTYVKNTTSETATSMVVFSNLKPAIRFSSIIGHNVSWSSQQGLLAVVNANPRSAVIRISSDYSTWTTVVQFSSNGSTMGAESGVFYGDSKWIALAGDNTRGYLFSTNGTNWTSRGSALQIYASYGGFYDGQQFVFTAGNNTYVVSTDGLNWTSLATPNTGSRGNATSELGAMYAQPSTGAGGTGSSLAFSTNKGVNWTTIATPGTNSTTGQVGSVTYGNGLFVFGAANTSNQPNMILTTNGSTFTQVLLPVPSGTTNSGSSVIVKFINGLFIVTVGHALAYYSTDGIIWSSMPGISIDSFNGRTAHQAFTPEPNRIVQTFSTTLATTDKIPYYAIYNTQDKTIN